MDYTVHGILHVRILEWVYFPFSRDLLNQGSNPGLLHCRKILYQLSHKGSPISLIGSAKFYVNLINSKSKPKAGTGVDETPVYNPFTAASGGYSSPAVG